MPTQIELTLNGTSRQIVVEPGQSLLEVLREQCGITSIKNGCAPQGQCGACLAIVNGVAKVTCVIQAEEAAGADILTLEGLSAHDRELCANAFQASAGVQCGFCIPGLALRAWWLLGRNPNPTRRDIARAIDVHLCRCTGYVKIVDAVELMARARRGEELPAPRPMVGLVTRWDAMVPRS